MAAAKTNKSFVANPGGKSPVAKAKTASTKRTRRKNAASGS